MADVVKKTQHLSELALKMVNAAVAKARELGVTETWRFSMTAASQGFSRMDGASIPTIEIAQKRRTQPVRRLHAGTFSTYQGDPSLLAGSTLARCARWRTPH